MTRTYYTAPSDEIFAEMKAAAREVWEGYDDPYRREKLERIHGVENVGDNFMYLFAMFDMENQRKVVEKLSPKAKLALSVRLLDGGSPQSYLDGIALYNP